MFDNPKKDLKWLEQQLLAEAPSQAAETPEEADWLEEAYTLLGETPPQSSGPEDLFQFLEEDAQEEFWQETSVQTPQKVRKEKGLGGLVFLACLETLGILALLIWWILWLT